MTTPEIYGIPGIENEFYERNQAMDISAKKRMGNSNDMETNMVCDGEKCYPSKKWKT